MGGITISLLRRHFFFFFFHENFSCEFDMNLRILRFRQDIISLNQTVVNRWLLHLLKLYPRNIIVDLVSTFFQTVVITTFF